MKPRSAHVARLALHPTRRARRDGCVRATRAREHAAGPDARRELRERGASSESASGREPAHPSGPQGAPRGAATEALPSPRGRARRLGALPLRRIRRGRQRAERRPSKAPHAQARAPPPRRHRGQRTGQPRRGDDRGELANRAPAEGRPPPERHRGAGDEQAQVGCCSAFSLASTLNNAIRRQNKSDAISPMHIWSHYFTPGMSPASAKNQGRPLALLSLWPYDEVVACKISQEDDACERYYHMQKETPPWEPEIQQKLADADAHGTWRMTSVTCVTGSLCNSTTPGGPSDPAILAAYVATGADLWAAMWIDEQAWYHPASGTIPDYVVPADASRAARARATASPSPATTGARARCASSSTTAGATPGGTRDTPGSPRRWSTSTCSRRTRSRWRTSRRRHRDRANRGADGRRLLRGRAGGLDHGRCAQSAPATRDRRRGGAPVRTRGRAMSAAAPSPPLSVLAAALRERPGYAPTRKTAVAAVVTLLRPGAFLQSASLIERATRAGPLVRAHRVPRRTPRSSRHVAPRDGDAQIAKKWACNWPARPC